ncbi:MAG TPA: hypothetical protein VIV12_06630 [Streptosporangiaceae bacterium]
MPKSSGLGDALFAAGYDLSGDINSLGRIGGGPSTLDVTGIDKAAFERLGGRRDGGIEFVAYFNPDAGQAHPRLSSLPTTDVLLTYCRGTTLGAPAAALVGKQVDYAGTRTDEGALTFAVQTQANGYGLEWGDQLTAGKRTDSTATSPATGVDLVTVSTAFGWQAYLHVFAFTGTSVTVTLQDSADNSAFTSLAGGSFTAATGVTSQRLQSATRTDVVRRYLRAITTGTFSNAVFSVMFTRNETSVLF